MLDDNARQIISSKINREDFGMQAISQEMKVRAISLASNKIEIEYYSIVENIKKLNDENA